MNKAFTMLNETTAVHCNVSRCTAHITESSVLRSHFIESLTFRIRMSFMEEPLKLWSGFKTETEFRKKNFNRELFLAYILAEEGYDVWMGNARGNYFSRRHTRLNPDAVLSNAFWEFSWDEIGNKDLPASIDYVLRQTGRSALHYIGFSQGTTVFFVMASLRPAYNSKIISMHAMAPVAYMGYNSSPLLNALAPYARLIEVTFLI